MRALCIQNSARHLNHRLNLVNLLIQGALDLAGLNVSFDAIARVNGDVLQGNNFGLLVATTSKVQGNFASRNNGTGIVVIRGQANIANCTIENNSGDGASVQGNALLNVNGCSFSKNGGNGVSLLSASYARLGTAVITGNAGAGVFLRDLSMANFPEASVTGNLGGIDINCAPQYSATRGTKQTGGTTNCVEP